MKTSHPPLLLPLLHLLTLLLITPPGSALKPIFIPDVDFSGYNLDGHPTSTAEDCAALCMANFRCVAASWNGPHSHFHDNNCNLHCSDAGRTVDPGEMGILVRPGGSLCHAPEPTPGWLPVSWQAANASGALLPGFLNESNAQIGNGYAAAMVSAGQEYLAGVYNGMLNYTQNTTPRRAAVPSALASLQMLVSIHDQPLPVAAAAVDLANAAFLTVVPPSLTPNRSDDALCTTTTFFHRAQPHLLVVHLACNNPGHAPLEVQLVPRVPESLNSTDFVFQPTASTADFACFEGTALVAEVPQDAPTRVGVCRPASLTLSVTVPPNQRLVRAWVSARFSSVDSDRPAPASSNLTQLALAAATAAAATDPDTLYAQHAAAQQQLRAGRVEIGGNVTLARVVNASAFALLAAVRDDVAFAPSPGGLATNGYNGHVFWDCATWMLPFFSFFHPRIARAVLAYRVERLGAARANAAANHMDGAMYPWESALTGTEVDPAKGTTIEEHIQSDIALAFRLYWQLSRNDSWLASTGRPVLEGIAAYWASKATPNHDGSYSIANVMGPDEYHGGVTDSVYVNYGAKVAMDFANAARSRDSAPPNATWAAVAAGLRILFNETLQYHPEFAGYQAGTTVKQADTILLRYPLQFNMSSAVHLNDLRIYNASTDPGGPAMTWAMFAINYGLAGMPEIADAFFQRSFSDNLVGNFLTWSEVAGGGGTQNFITGAGGFMQGLVVLYGGLQVDDSSLRFSAPRPPPGATSIALRSVAYAGSTLDVEVHDAKSFSVRLVAAGTVPLHITFLPCGKVSPVTQPLTTTGVCCESRIDAIITPAPGYSVAS